MEMKLIVHGLKRLRCGWLVVLCGLVGCSGDATPTGEPPVQNTALQEFGEMYRMYIKETKKPPENGKPLMKYTAGYSHGTMAIQNKTIDAFWGAKLEPESKSVLAYEKQAPESGGVVLLQDGETIKSMTAEEFKASPKAGK